MDFERARCSDPVQAPCSESPPGETLELGKFEPSCSRYDIVFHLQCCVGLNQPVSTDLIECENFDELCIAVANVPEGVLMALSVSDTYDCSGYYCSGGICHDTTAQEFLDSFDLLGVFDDRETLLSRASREIKKVAAKAAEDFHLVTDPDGIVFNGGSYGALSRRLEHSWPSHVSVLYSSTEGRVAMLLKVSRCQRLYCTADGVQRHDIYDIIVQQITSRTPRCGHGTDAIMVLAAIAAQLDPPRGVQLQQTITPAGKALGRRLVRERGFTADSDELNYFSPIPAT